MALIDEEAEVNNHHSSLSGGAVTSSRCSETDDDGRVDHTYEKDISNKDEDQENEEDARSCCEPPPENASTRTSSPQSLRITRDLYQDQTLRKRSREKQRRNDISAAIHNLTTALAKIDPQNIVTHPHSKQIYFSEDSIIANSKRRRNGGSSLSDQQNQPLNRTEIINYTIEMIEKLVQEKEALKFKLYQRMQQQQSILIGGSDGGSDSCRSAGGGGSSSSSLPSMQRTVFSNAGVPSTTAAATRTMLVINPQHSLSSTYDARLQQVQVVGIPSHAMMTTAHPTTIPVLQQQLGVQQLQQPTIQIRMVSSTAGANPLAVFPGVVSAVAPAPTSSMILNAPLTAGGINQEQWSYSQPQYHNQNIIQHQSHAPIYNPIYFASAPNHQTTPYRPQSFALDHTRTTGDTTQSLQGAPNRPPTAVLIPSLPPTGGGTLNARSGSREVVDIRGSSERHVSGGSLYFMNDNTK